MVKCGFFQLVVFLVVTVHCDTIDDYLVLPKASSIREHLYNLTSHSHLAGTPANERTAQYVEDLFKAAGLEVEWHTFEALLSQPREHSVSLIFPPDKAYNCSLVEPPVAIDPTSSQPDAPPTFNGYAGNGEVEAELVYANYGLIEDFEYLESKNISVSGKIVIVRYGKNFRGVKVYLAQRRGAIGVLIYSDPQDDGIGRGPVYPNGPWRPEYGVQRGSVQFLNICPGDPRRVEECLGDATANYTGKLIPDIPVHPLSWGDAKFLLAELHGEKAPAGWQGGIPQLANQYHIGPGPARVHLYSLQDFAPHTLINVCGTIKGSHEETEGFVLLGNHRDAWGFGGADPNAGTAVMLEVASSLGTLLSRGWKPRRSLVFCSWDGEEYALLGSTAWSASHPGIVSKAVAYLNVDVAVSGFNFTASASASLSAAINQATSRVPEPGGAVSLGVAWPQAESHWGGWDGTFGVLGSGSDYTSFLHHFGVPAVDLSFEGHYGVYHSIYDSFTWVDLFGDPGFLRSRAMSQVWGTLALLLSEPETIPLWYNDTAAALYSYLSDVNQSASELVQLGGLKSSIDDYARQAEILSKEMVSQNFEVGAINTINRAAERNFLSCAGLPNRPYYKHVLQAPGIFLGYGSDVFPGLTEAIRAKDWAKAQQQAEVIATVIKAAAVGLSLPAQPKGLTPAQKVAIVLGSLFGLCVIGYCIYRKRRAASRDGYEAM